MRYIIYYAEQVGCADAYHFMKSGNKKWNSQKLIAKVEIPVATSARCDIRSISRPINWYDGCEGAFSGMDRVGASVSRGFVVYGGLSGFVANATRPRRGYGVAPICPLNHCIEYVSTKSRRFVAARRIDALRRFQFRRHRKELNEVISTDGDLVHLNATRIIAEGFSGSHRDRGGSGYVERHA
jgi:hypothetical protein